MKNLMPRLMAAVKNYHITDKGLALVRRREIKEWRAAALEALHHWDDEYEDGYGRPAEIDELASILCRYASGYLNPQNQADWLDNQLRSTKA